MPTIQEQAESFVAADNKRHERLRVLRLALKIAKAEKARREEYRAERAKGWLNYCIHGTYIGDPYGPDYLCGACEADDGLSEAEEIYGEALYKARKALADFDADLAAYNRLSVMGHFHGIDTAPIVQSFMQSLDV